MEDKIGDFESTAVLPGFNNECLLTTKTLSLAKGNALSKEKSVKSVLVNERFLKNLAFQCSWHWA